MLGFERLRIWAGVTVVALCLGGCASRATGLMRPVSVADVPGVTVIPVLVTTMRRSSPDDAILFTGERSLHVSYAEIGVSIPPDHKPGEIEWPERAPGDPAKTFVTASVTKLDNAEFKSALDRELAQRQKSRVLVFVHGYNNKFDDAVYRFAQIEKDSQAPTVPVLFTWPSAGKLLAYPYDRESANFSRTGLEKVLQSLVDDPKVKEVAVLAHSMGNWVTLEALRQMAIRHGAVPAKIEQVMLAAPDVDVDVARTQVDDMGPHRPHFTLFVSQDDRALAASKRFWGSRDRLGAIDPDKEPYRSAIERLGVTVIDLTKLKGGDSLNHGKFAESPQVVQFIGNELASDKESAARSGGLGSGVGGLIAGVTSTAAGVAAAAVEAPVAVVDAGARADLSERLQSVAPGTSQEEPQGLADGEEAATKPKPGSKRPSQ
jgi:esterase/lipase superfamily enzyme